MNIVTSFPYGIWLEESNGIVNIGGHANHSSYIQADVYTDGHVYVVWHYKQRKYIEVIKTKTRQWVIR
jgi:hypothetical protein